MPDPSETSFQFTAEDLANLRDALDARTSELVKFRLTLGSDRDAVAATQAHIDRNLRLRGAFDRVPADD